MNSRSRLLPPGGAKSGFLALQPLVLLSALIFPAPAVHAQQVAELAPEILKYDPFVWKSEPPEDCPFEPSESLTGIRFLGIKSGYRYGDTWYPSWASDDVLYSPWTDGKTKRLDGYLDWSQSWVDPEHITTGQGVIIGDDPLTMKAYSIGLDKSSPAAPYHGRYPCGSLGYNGVWYYGTYCLDPAGFTKWGDVTVNWPWLGPFVGFRYSTDKGHGWTPCPHEPEKPIFGETGIHGYPVKIGAPHFVDFGKNMEHSPDGKAMKHFGEQGYFVNIPTKFISADGHTAWLLYSGNYWSEMNGQNLKVNPPGGHYGMTFQKVELLTGR